MIYIIWSIAMQYVHNVVERKKEITHVHYKASILGTIIAIAAEGASDAF